MDPFARYKTDKDFVLATHVFANVAHFRKLLDEFPWSSLPNWINWGLLEATLVKARAIADFLITDAHAHPDDFGACSMVSNWVLSQSEFLELRELVNKQVAHFAQQRFIGDRQEVAITPDDLIVQLTEVNKAFSRFESELNEVNPDLYSELTKQFLVLGE